MARTLVLTAAKVRSALSGSALSSYLLKLGDTAAQDAVINAAIGTTQARVERRTGTLLTRRVIKGAPVESGLVQGTDYDLVEKPYPFYREDFSNFGRIRLLRRPVVTVERLLVRFGENVNVFAPPDAWFEPFVDSANGTVNVIPYIGGMSVGPVAAIGLIPLQLGLGGHPLAGEPGHFIPSLITVDYTAGFLPSDFNATGDDPFEACPDYDIATLIDAVKCFAAAVVLEDLQTGVGANSGSISMDGFSQSGQGNRLEGAIKSFTDKAEAYIQEWNASDSILAETL